MTLFNLIRKRMLSLAACRRGTSGLEFAIMAPIFLGFLVVMTDIGLAFNQQINLDQSIRAGAQFVMSEVTDLSEIEDLVSAAATGADPNDPDDVRNEDAPSVDAVKTCKCPGSAASVDCDTLCTVGNIPPFTYYDLEATKVYEAIVLPDIRLSSEIQVQVR
jgi:hypothetical protein